MTFTHSLWVNSDKSKEKQRELGDCTFWNCYIKGASQMEQYHSSFRGAPKTPRKNEFYGFNFGETWQNNIIKTRIRTLYILLYTGCSSKEALLLLL